MPLAVITIGGTGALASAIGSWGDVRPWSLATAYVGLALLSATLILGPVTVLRRRRWPVSSDLRRDVGIWAAVAGTAHVVFGLQVHMSGQIIRYFTPSPGTGSIVRIDKFGAANYLGLAAVAILLLLLSLSSDLTLRALGARRWKRLHRLAYALFGLVILHGVLYLVLEHRVYPLIGLLVAVAGVVAAAQLAGFMRRRAARQHRGMVAR